MSEIKLENVTKEYNKRKVINNLSLKIKDGECFTFLGPSACGKTVLLRMIAGFEIPSEGDIYLGERLVSSPAKNVFLPPEQRKIGVVFQDYAVWPHMNAFDNVAYPLKKRNLEKTEIKAMVMKTLTMVGLKGLEYRFPYQLSGGQQQRVALARALVMEPEVMLLDEPLCNLDANLREEMRFEIKYLQRRTGVTIIYVTHDQEVAMAISDRMMVMDKDGNPRQIGAPDEIFENPADRFIHGFLGLSNFIPVEICEGGVFVKNNNQNLKERIFIPNIPYPENFNEKSAVIAVRPADVILGREMDGLIGIVKRVAYLGNIVDYRIAVGKSEIRVQRDSQIDFNTGFFKEGEHCNLKFEKYLFYPL